ncbi:MAG TPA: hypothetical protein VMN78_09175 [Longimicrobiales bacterium]|nr:hypothetical protein [Longimicrobiales bacterium]
MTDREMVRLEAGSVVALRMYDLGRALDVDALARAAGGDVERPQFPSAAGGGLRYTRPPVELTLDDVEVPLEGGRLFADTTVRIFDFGIAVVALRVLVGGLDWDRFAERVEEIGAAVEGEAQAWSEVEERLRRTLQPARLRLDGKAVARHVFVIARRFGAPLPVDQLVDEEYAAGIVSSDWLPLTSTARADLLRGARAAGSDLVVTGEERTFIVEPVPGSGVPDAIEAALAQRAFYDLARTLGLSPTSNGRGSREVRGRAARARRRLGYADVAVMPERTGRLAAMYATARDRFRVGEAESAADRRLASLTAGGPGGRLPLLPLVVVALLAAVATALIFLVLG